MAVEKIDSIDGVKSKISEYTGIAAYRQQLSFDKRHLEDDRPISEYNIKQVR